jgi:hypothetical protein
MRKLIGTSIIAAILTTPVLALDLVPVGQAGDWAILQDPNHENNCLTEGSMSDGTVVRVGFRKAGKEGIMAVFNPAWGEMKLGKNHPVEIMMGADTFVGKAEKRELNKARGMDVFFDNAQFVADFANAEDMTIMADGAELAKISLKGSKDAVEALLVCQATVKG